MTNDDAPARAAKGLLAGWLTAKTTTWAARLTVWGMWLAAFAAYGGYVWWRVRRTLKADPKAGDESSPPISRSSGDMSA